MTDQFSPEYIEFVRKAKCLQDEWRPKAGDTVLAQPWEITGLEWWSAPAQQVGELEEDGELFWLPTLWDLLQIIEGAGCTWERDEEEWTLWGPGDNTYASAAEWLDENDNDDMLAAAKLAVRALEGPR
jgi:hypothetical protein